MIVGIETTAHTFGVGVVRKGKILANVRDMYKPASGGIVPMDAAKHHREVANIIFQEALEKAGVGDKDIEAIAVSNAPGLAPCLLAGLEFAKRKARTLDVPLVPVNHCIAHLEIGQHEGAKNPVLLYASGANTQIIAYESGKYRIFGETLDIGVGNFIDNFAREMGIGFPGGLTIQKLAENGKNYIELPYVVKGMDISLSGILTNLKQKFESKNYSKEDLAYSMQETVFAMLVETAERALAHTGKKELLLGGGVSCNSRLQEMCKKMCEQRGAKFFVPSRDLLVDNGAMIAFLGEIMFNRFLFRKRNYDGRKTEIAIEKKDFDKLDIKPRQRTDEVEFSWN